MSNRKTTAVLILLFQKERVPTSDLQEYSKTPPKGGLVLLDRFWTKDLFKYMTFDFEEFCVEVDIKLVANHVRYNQIIILQRYSKDSEVGASFQCIQG